MQNDAPWLAKAANNQSTSSNSPASNFTSLGTALQSGDISGAQKAFAQLQQSIHGHRGHHRRMDAGDSETNGVGQNLRALASALQNGDLSGAQSAFTTLQQKLPASNSSTGTSSGNNPVQDLASALQSGNLPGAQEAFASFLQTRGPQGGVSLYAPVGTLGVFGGQQSGGLIDATA